MSAPLRRNWLDEQRGLAVLFMVEVHALNAWLAPGVGYSVVHEALSLLGGLAAPAFLYMAGLSQSLSVESQARRGVPARARLATALRRALVVVAAAYAFRVLEYVLGAAWLERGGWRGLFAVDVLNVIGVGLVLSALLGAVPARARPPAFALAAAATALVTPLLAAWRGAPAWLARWLYATPPASFALFPWLTFLLAGAAVGELVAGRDRPRALLALALGLVLAGLAGGELQVYPHQDYWHASPAWVAIRLGVVVALSGGLQLVRAGAALAPLRTMGRHSLLAYVASVELTYGLAARPLQRALSTAGVLAGTVALSAIVWALAAVADRREARRRASAVSRART